LVKGLTLDIREIVPAGTGTVESAEVLGYTGALVERAVGLVAFVEGVVN
jgi:hypothetical protein